VGTEDDLRAVAAERDQLQQALATRPVIEEAKGMLMLARGCGADEAFAALRQISQRTNIKLHDVATVIVAVGSRTEPNLADDRVVQLVLREARRSIDGAAGSGPANPRT